MELVITTVKMMNATSIPKYAHPLYGIYIPRKIYLSLLSFISSPQEITNDFPRKSLSLWVSLYFCIFYIN